MAKNDKPISFGMIYGAICAGILIISGVIVLNSIYQQHRSDKQMHAYVLGEATSCGYIGVKITYDIEPVDVILYSPDGQKFAPDTMASNVQYNVDEKHHTVTLLADSDKLGIWSAEFNTKKNKKIDYCLIQTPSDTLYMTPAVLYTGNDGAYHVKFSTSMSAKEHDTARCSMILEKTSFSYCISDTTINLNEETDIPITFPDHVFTDEDYTLKVSVYVKGAPTPAKSLIEIHIDSRTIESIEDTETETDEESEEKTEGE